MLLGNGIAAVRTMLDSKLNVGIGTDGASCCDNQNMYESLRTAAYVSNGKGPDNGRWLASEEILEAATAGSARALGLRRQARPHRQGLQGRSRVRRPRRTSTGSRATIPPTSSCTPRTAAPCTPSWSAAGWWWRTASPVGLDLAALAKKAEAARERLAAANAGNKALFERLQGLVNAFCPGLAKTPYHIDHFAGAPSRALRDVAFSALPPRGGEGGRRDCYESRTALSLFEWQGISPCHSLKPVRIATNIGRISMSLTCSRQCSNFICLHPTQGAQLRVTGQLHRQACEALLRLLTSWVCCLGCEGRNANEEESLDPSPFRGDGSRRVCRHDRIALCAHGPRRRQPDHRHVGSLGARRQRGANRHHQGMGRRGEGRRQDRLHHQPGQQVDADFGRRRARQVRPRHHGVHELGGSPARELARAHRRCHEAGAGAQRPDRSVGRIPRQMEGQVGHGADDAWLAV